MLSTRSASPGTRMDRVEDALAALRDCPYGSAWHAGAECQYRTQQAAYQPVSSHLQSFLSALVWGARRMHREVECLGKMVQCLGKPVISPAYIQPSAK